MADTAAVQLVAGRSLCYTAGRLQEIDTAQVQNSSYTAWCLGNDRGQISSEQD